MAKMLKGAEGGDLVCYFIFPGKLHGGVDLTGAGEVIIGSGMFLPPEVSGTHRKRHQAAGLMGGVGARGPA